MKDNHKADVSHTDEFDRMYQEMVKQAEDKYKTKSEYPETEDEARNICGDNRFKVIARAKEALLNSTNIETSEDEMKVLDNFLFRCWQMGWLDRYDEELTNIITKVDVGKFLKKMKE